MSKYAGYTEAPLGSYGSLYNEVSSMDVSGRSSSTGNTIDFLLSINTEPTYREITKVETSIYRILEGVKRATGSEDLASYVNYTQKVINMTRSALWAIHALEIASGPIGWLYAGTTILATGMLMADTLSSMEAYR